MITEDYVSFEIAKLLKEKGFEYSPDESYWLIDANNKMYWVSCIGAYDYVNVPVESFQRPKNGYRLVTQAMAMKWLREAHGLFIRITEDMTGNVFEWSVYQKNYGCKASTYVEDSYEKACETAIKYCLENLI